MFESIRAHQKVLQAILLVLILPAFVFFGISGYEGLFADDRALARVGREAITQEALSAAQQQQLESMRSMLGDAVDASLFDTPQARTDLLEALIGQRTLTQQAALRHVRVSDDRVRQIIMDLPGLKRADGTFDEGRYQALLGAQGLTPARFEAQLRTDAAAQLLGDVAQQTLFMPRTVRDRLIALQEEARVVRVRRYAPAAYEAQVKPSQQELEAFYQAHASEFERPESAGVEYVVLSREALASQVTISAEAVRAHYAENAARYEEPEQRRASHILIKAGAEGQAQAEALVAQLKTQPQAFAELARTRSQDPGSAAAGGDLGFFARDMMVKPFADAVFAMAEQEIRGPIETEFGWHIIRLDAIKPAARRPLTAVQGEIEQALRAQQVAQQYAEAAEAFANMVYEQSDSLQPVVQKWPLRVQSVEAVTRTPQAGAPALPAALAHPKVLAALFSDDVLHKKRNTEAIEIGPGQLVAARIASYQPAQRRELAEVQDEVKRRVIQDAARRLAEEAGQAQLAALRGGAAAQGSGWSEAQTVSRAQRGGLAAAELEALFKLDPQGQAQARFVGVDQGPAGYTVMQLVEVRPAPPEQIAQKRPTYEAQWARVGAQQSWRDYIESLKSRSKVERHPERLAAR